MADSSNRITIVVALITVLGTLGTALLANWDKVFAQPAPPVASIPAEARSVAASGQSNRVTPSAKEPEQAVVHQAALVAGPAPDDDKEADTASAQPRRIIPRIGGVWHDVDNPTNGARIKQDGHNFEFARYGVLPNGVSYQSTGTGTLRNRKVNVIYVAKYQSGDSSSGQCEGALSDDGQRIDMSCQDSLLGNFVSASIR